MRYMGRLFTYIIIISKLMQAIFIYEMYIFIIHYIVQLMHTNYKHFRLLK